MDFLDIVLSGKTLLILGALISTNFIALIIWMAARYSNKKNA